MPSLRIKIIAAVCLLIAGSVTGIGVLSFGPTHSLAGVAVSTTTVNESARVDLQVYAAGGSRQVANQTVTVHGAEFHQSSNDSGVQKGIVSAGQVTVADGWNGRGNYEVRARLAGRENWSRLDLGRLDRENDPSLIVRLLQRHRLEDWECFGVRVSIDEHTESGVNIRQTSCALIDA